MDEWVEVQGKTVDLAVDVAMTELGVTDRADIEVEVVQEPQAGGFLGRGRQEAIVRVTKAPRKRRRRRGRGRNQDDRSDDNRRKNQNEKSPKPKQGKGQGKNRQAAGGDRDRNSGGNGASRDRNEKRQEPKVSKSDSERSADDRPEQAPIEEQAEVAKEFISGLLEAFGLEGKVETRIDEDVMYIDVSGTQTEALIGPKGSVMQSVLELTRTVVQRRTYGAPRMRIDIGGYVERRREALRIYASKLAAQVIEDKGEIMLEPMNAADRKVLHDAVAEIDDVRTYSEGEDPRRAVVIAYSGPRDEEE